MKKLSFCLGVWMLLSCSNKPQEKFNEERNEKLDLSSYVNSANNESIALLATSYNLDKKIVREIIMSYVEVNDPVQHMLFQMEKGDAMELSKTLENFSKNRDVESDTDSIIKYCAEKHDVQKEIVAKLIMNYKCMENQNNYKE